MLLGRRVHVEVGFGGGPVVVDLVEDGADQAQERFGCGEDAGDAGAALDLLVEALGGVGGAHADPVFGRQGQHGQAFGDVGFKPVGEFRGALAVTLDHGFEKGLGLEESRNL